MKRYTKKRRVDKRSASTIMELMVDALSWTTIWDKKTDCGKTAKTEREVAEPWVFFTSSQQVPEHIRFVVLSWPFCAPAGRPLLMGIERRIACAKPICTKIPVGMQCTTNEQVHRTRAELPFRLVKQ
jgi:hypothetical protein